MKEIQVRNMDEALHVFMQSRTMKPFAIALSGEGGG
jgi:hypothetical protein